ncbi:hypothetical protein V6N13_111380 [Hibiscus sabdariffa]|uniref:Uncharacterized protein n=1 Tax=Hibiscus sabdariffa TaxID=183260 RepID=A0ABR2TKH6_9ROSI
MADFNNPGSNERQRANVSWKSTLDKVLLNDMLGFSDAKENEGNTNILSKNSFTVNSFVRSYNIDEGNVGVLRRIFQENPYIDREFKFKYSYFQNVFMNEMARLYHKLESNPGIFEEKDITRMEQMVNDMELAGLNLTWLKDRLATIGEILRKDNLNASWRSTDLDKVLLNDMPGSSDAKANETNMNILSNKSFTVNSMVRSYGVDEGNVGVLSRIFQENPNMDREFKLKYPYFQNVLMNEIAGCYRSLENNPEVEEVVGMYEMVKDMELTGLELTWLKDRVSKVNETLKKRYQEMADKLNRDAALLKQTYFYFP